MAILLSPCCAEPLVSFSSLNHRVCIQCHAKLPWKLEQGETSICGDRFGGSENYVSMKPPAQPDEIALAA